MDELIKRFENLESQMKDLKKKFLTSYITIAQRKVLEKIRSRTIRRSGNLENSVIAKIGSGGGYAVTKSPIGRAPHSHLIEDGHVVKNKKGGSILGYAAGRHMYRDSLLELENNMNSLLFDLEQQIVRGLVG